MRALKRVLTQKRKQVDFALQFVLALDLVQPQQKLALGGFEQVVAVDRSFRDTARAGDAAETVIVGELLEERFA